jgi:hypothetical protein
MVEVLLRAADLAEYSAATRTAGSSATSDQAGIPHFPERIGEQVESEHRQSTHLAMRGTTAGNICFPENNVAERVVVAL